MTVASSIGVIYVQVKGDTTQFEKDMAHLKSWASKSGTEVSNALNNAITPKTASLGIKALSDDLSRLAQSAKSSSQGFTQSATQIASGLSSVAKQAGITEAQYASMIEKMLRNRALTTATSSLKTLSNAMGLTAKESRALAIQMGYSSTQADKMAGSVKKMQGGMSSAHTTAASFTRSIGMMTAELIGFGSAIAAAYTIKELGIAIYKTGQETLVADNAYKAITGSVAAAEKEMAFLRQTSGELGLNFYTLRDGYKGFLAAAQSSKIPMDEVQKIFRSISNASAVMGLSAEKTSLVFLALEQIMSKGKVSMEEIRRQLGDSLPGAFQIGARAMGMTVEAFDKAVSAGEVYSEDFLPKFRVAMEESFQGTIADSVRALNELAMAWEDAKNQMAQGDFMGSIVDGMREITVMLKDPDLLRGLADFTGMMGKLVALAGKYAAFQGKSFGSAMLQNEAGRLQGAGFVGAEIWGMSEDQMRSVINYYQEVEKLSASAAEKMASNAEGAKDQVVATTQEAKAALMTAEAELRAFMSDQSSLFPGPSYYNTLAELESKVRDVKSTLNEQLTTDSWLIKAREEMQALLTAANAVPLDPLIQKLEEERDARGAAADKIEEDVLKRIAKTDDAKLASYKADLAAYKASGRDKKEIEVQLNADIQAIYDKRNAEADRARKAAIAADKKALTDKQAANREMYATEIAMAENLAADTWQLRDEGLKKAIEQHEDTQTKITQMSYDAEEKRIKDAEKAQEKAIKKAIAEQEKAYQHMYDNIHDINAELWSDFMDGGENAFDIILKYAKKTFAQILATWSTKIVMNVLVGDGSSGSGGIISSLLGSVTGGSDSGGSSGGIIQQIAGKLLTKGLDTAGINLESLTGLFSSSMAGNGISTASSASGIGAGQFGGASSGTAAGGSGLLAGMGSAAFFAAYAMMASKILGELWEDKPSVYFRASELGGYGERQVNDYSRDWEDPEFTYTELQSPNGAAWGATSPNFDYYIGVKDTGQDPEVQKQVWDYFDSIFFAIEENIGVSMAEVLKEHQYFGTGVGLNAQGIAGLSKEVFSEMLGTLLLDMLPDEGSIDKIVSSVVGAEIGYHGGDPNNPEDWRNGDVNQISIPVYEDITRQVSKMAEIFNTEFFDAIAPEGGNEWDSLLAFGKIVKDNEDFMADFNRQMEEFGETAVQAFKNIQTIDTILEGVESGIEGVTKIAVEEDTTIQALIDSWSELNKILVAAHASTEDLAEAERGRNIDIGAAITGLTATSLKNLISGTGTVEDLIQQTISKDLAGNLAETLMEETITAMIEEAGRIRAEVGEDAAIAFMEGFDFTEVNKQIAEFRGGIEDLGEAAFEAFKGISALDKFATKWVAIQSDLYSSNAEFISGMNDYATKVKSGAITLEEFTATMATFGLTADEAYDLLSDAVAVTNAILNERDSIIRGILDPSALRELDLLDLDASNRPLQEFVWSLEDAQTAIDNASEAFDNIQDTITGILGSNKMGVQSKAYFEDQYASRLSAAQSDPTKIADFTGFANSYLDFISDYGDPKAMERVLNDLYALQGALPEQISMASEITGGKTLADIYAILEANGLGSIVPSTTEGSASNPYISMVTNAYAGIGRSGFGSGRNEIDQSGFSYWINQLMSGGVSTGGFQSEFDRAASRWQFGDNGWVSFAGGGMISGPESGYTIPTTFHGTEHISTDSDMKDVKSLLQALVNKSSGGNGDTQIKVFIGNKELKSITAEIVRTDPETQTQIRRVARV